ncbi:MAG: helix-turn-helix transcriptional regulator [Bacteroides sp.]
MKIYDYNGRKDISGERIRQLRVTQKMTQEQFAAKMQVAGVTIERDSVSRIEKGTRFVPDYEIIVVSRIFNVSPSWLLGIE